MMKKKLNKLDLNIYTETLDNGLQIYVIPKCDANNIYTTFTTKYGSMINEFTPIEKNKMVKYPNGIAHFLEHKVFEQENGEDPFSFFEKRGISANANTSSEKTTYLFSGITSFKESLNYLLDFVQSPYFTEENVEKEKGIIKEELDMYKDDPFTVLYEKSLFNTFSSNPIRFSVGGTCDSINEITKDMLYECYNTFYHPKNMFLVVTGNVDPEDVFNIAKENQLKKKFLPFKKIKIKKSNENDKVFKEYEEIDFDVAKTKVSLNIKINIEKLPYSLFEIRNYIYYFFELKLGITGFLVERLKKEEIINYDIGINVIQAENYIDIMIVTETDKPDYFIEEVMKEIKNKSISKEDFERKKKVLVSSYINMGDNIFSLNHKIINNLIRYDKVFYDDFTMIKNLNSDDCNKLLSMINFDNYDVVVLKKNN